MMYACPCLFEPFVCALTTDKLCREQGIRYTTCTCTKIQIDRCICAYTSRTVISCTQRIIIRAMHMIPELPKYTRLFAGTYMLLRTLHRKYIYPGTERCTHSKKISTRIKMYIYTTYSNIVTPRVIGGSRRYVDRTDKHLFTCIRLPPITLGVTSYQSGRPSRTM